MDYNDKIAAGLRDLDDVRWFHKFFPNAEPVIVRAKHDFEPDGWRVVDEWISRAKLYDRYVFWLALPIEFTGSGVSPLGSPGVSMVELEKVDKGRNEDDGPKWSCSFSRLEQEDWQELVQEGGDFEALGAELITDAPVEGFEIFWRDTTPPPEDPARDGLALHAPLRYSS